MAHHLEAGNAKASYVYLVMASFGTLALLLAFGLLTGSGGDYRFAGALAARDGEITRLRRVEDGCRPTR